jgi:hypothetical protein
MHYYLLIHNPTDEGNDPVWFAAKLKDLNGQQIVIGLYLIQVSKSPEAIQDFLRTECGFIGHAQVIPLPAPIPV